MMFREKAWKRSRSKKQIICCNIGQVRLWKSVSYILMVLLLCMVLQRVAEGYLAGQELEFIEYRKVQSKLADKDACLLCGDDARSMIKYYRQFDTIGLISLNDWYMVDFSLQSEGDTLYDGEVSGGSMLSGSESSGGSIPSGRKSFGGVSSGSNLTARASSGTALSQINTGLMRIFADSMSSGHRAAMQVTWEKDLALDTTLVEERLCSDCLEKVLDSLTISKRRYENKSPIPLCLVDFRTLELYSMQDWQTEYCIRDYWVDLRYFDDGVSIKAYC